MHFTTNLLPESYCAALQLALAPERRFPKIEDAQVDAYRSTNSAAYEMSAQDVSLADVATMVQVMNQLQQLSPRIKLRVTLVAGQRWQHGKPSVCHNMAIAIASTKISLDSLSLSHSCIPGLQEHLSEHGYDYTDLIHRTSSLSRFRFWRAHNTYEKSVSTVTDDQLLFVEEIIESAKGLRYLEMDLGSMKAHAGSFLLARSPPALKDLDLTGLTVSGHVLLDALHHYKSTLKAVKLTSICLHPIDNGWLAIFAAMLESLRLDYVFLCYIAVGTPSGPSRQALVNLRHLTSGTKHGDMQAVSMDGEQAVAEGLRELLSKLLTFV